MADPESAPLLTSHERRSSADTLRALDGVFFAAPDDNRPASHDLEPAMSSTTPSADTVTHTAGRAVHPMLPPPGTLPGNMQSSAPAHILPVHAMPPRTNTPQPLRRRSRLQHLPSGRTVFSYLGVALLLFFLYLTIASKMHPPPMGPGRKTGMDVGARHIFDETLTSRQVLGERH
ncbi:hypothetical protein THASP1DRAFT_30919 [Thamnocephalis sphaerospora]|uniref:Uncharacterized protein n=1 Tax=Thamnocephalis sphaerospora TaxID=78915 RepID=A0A4P9XMX0_9FUNG|nr:hypothetical protein THASP1DRAFT_30919 [Thamnocephalis sphaerospora]|eukprot:RKP07268.1 hypothetical protein THASP1DRAFT_30919 [Thamnocephalis sphaerospora]